MLALYRRVLAARRASPALRHGDWVRCEAPPGILVYERRTGDDRRVIAANFGPGGRPVPTPSPGGGDWTVDVATDHRRDGSRWAGRLDAESAVVLRTGD
jgi:alpha-glucosidase